MPANAALDATELSRLTAAEQIAPVTLSFEPETLVASATVASTPDFPLITLATSGESAGFTSIKAGQRVKIMDSTSTTLKGYYRVREGLLGTHSIPIGEVENADSGLLAAYNRTAGVVSGDKVYVYENYDLWSKKPYFDAATKTVYQDRNVAVGTNNSTPEVIGSMTINGLPGDRKFDVAQGGTQALTCVVSIVRLQTSFGSSATYVWSYPSGFTGVSGATTATLTATAPVGSHRVYCTISDSIAGAVVITRWIRVHDPSSPAINCIITADTADRTGGRRMTIRLPLSTASTIPPGARVIIGGVPTWGGSDVSSKRGDFVGFVTSQPFETRPGYHETTITVESPAGVLDKLHSYGANFTYDGAGATWENLAGLLSNIHFMMFWVLRWRVANFLNTFNFTMQDTTGATGRRLNMALNPGSVWSQLKTLADSLDLNIGGRSDGEIIAAALPYMLNDHSGVVTRVTLSRSLYSFTKPMWQRRAVAGNVKVDGWYSDTTVDTRYIAEAPGVNTFGQGTGQTTGSNKTFESGLDARQKAGKRYAHDNNEYPQIQIEVPTNYDIFEAADCQRIILQISAADSPTGSALSLNCLVNNVTKQWILGRRAKIALQLEVETNGVDGIESPVPTQVTGGGGNNIVPVIEPVDITPTSNGATVIAWTFSYIGLTVNWLNSSPTWTAIAGPSGSIVQVLLDPFSPFLTSGSGTVGAWCLTTTGLYYTTSIIAPSWVLKNALSPGTDIGGRMRAPIWASGVVYVGWTNESSLNAKDSVVHAARLSNYGSTVDWSTTVGSAHNGYTCIDIDQYGSDEMLIAAKDNAVGFSVYRILAGSASRITGTTQSSNYIDFVQKPLYTFGGASNTSTSSSESFIYTYPAHFMVTSNGGSSVSNVTPGWTSQAPRYTSSVVYTDDANRIAAVSGIGEFSTSTDGGTTWTSRGTDIAAHSLTTGYFPRLLSGGYALYMGGTSKLTFSPDFGVTLQDKTGDWASAVGSATDFVGAIPLY